MSSTLGHEDLVQSPLQTLHLSQAMAGMKGWPFPGEELVVGREVELPLGKEIGERAYLGMKSVWKREIILWERELLEILP